jgi:hypothetical protein
VHAPQIDGSIAFTAGPLQPASADAPLASGPSGMLQVD